MSLLWRTLLRQHTVHKNFANCSIHLPENFCPSNTSSKLNFKTLFSCTLMSKDSIFLSIKNVRALSRILRKNQHTSPSTCQSLSSYSSNTWKKSAAAASPEPRFNILSAPAPERRSSMSVGILWKVRAHSRFPHPNTV